jgi:hypothetical protein
MKSHLQIIPSPSKAQSQIPLLLYDVNFSQVFKENTEQIFVYKNETLASLSLDKLSDFQKKWQKEIVIVQPDDLFLKEFYFVDLESALPGGLFPETRDGDPIIFNDKIPTPLIPLNPILLDYFTPEDLVSRLSFQPLQENQVRLTLNLTLSGKEESQIVYPLFKDYELKEANAFIDQLPVLEIWPNFRVEGWKEYYSFYYDAELADETFSVHFPNAKYVPPFKQGQGVYQMAKFDQFPEAIHCLDSNKEIIGLILLKSPPILSTKNKWSVGVDFNALFTNIYCAEPKSSPKPLVLTNLLVQITQSNLETRLPSLFAHFIPENFIPREKPLPLSSILTIQGYKASNRTLLPILDGRIYVPDKTQFEVEEVWIKSNLCWSSANQPYIECFLGQLGLQVSALAINLGIAEIEWFLSYPSQFFQRDKLSYLLLWQDLIEKWEQTTGIRHRSPKIDSNNFRSQSLAFAQYFADFEDHNLVYTTCLYLLDETTDISIWENNQLIYQKTIRFGQEDLFNSFLVSNYPFIEKRLKVYAPKWRNLEKKFLSKKLDNWLRIESENWLKTERPLLENEKDFNGLLQLSTIALAGLYYYIGIILKGLYIEGKYKRSRITPVYVGGRGAKVFDWLDSRGAFNKNSEVNMLLSRMLSFGSQFEDTEEVTQLSHRLDDEVACGLILNRTKLKQTDNLTSNLLILGESSQITLRNFEGESQEHQINQVESLFTLNRTQEIASIDVNLVVLPQFLYQFHRALRDLNIQTITPIKGFVHSPERNGNQKLWDNTQRELDHLILQEIDRDNTSLEPSFILGLKALLRVLAEQWANSY